MQAVDKTMTGLAQADAQLRANAADALASIRTLKENLATLANVIEKLERQSRG